MRVGPFDDDIGSSALLAATSGNSGEDPPRTAPGVYLAEPNRHCGGVRSSGRQPGVFKGEPYGWEVGWSLVTEHFRLLADN